MNICTPNLPDCKKPDSGCLAGGRSFGDEATLRDDYGTLERMPDLGYPRLIAQEETGKLLCMYYWATAELPRQHIAATSFAPPGTTSSASL